MIRMKKLLAKVLASVLIFSCVGCGDSSGKESAAEDNEALTVIGFSQPGAESAWRVALTDSVQEAFSEDRGYKLIYKDGQSKQDHPFPYSGVRLGHGFIRGKTGRHSCYYL